MLQIVVLPTIEMSELDEETKRWNCVAEPRPLPFNSATNGSIFMISTPALCCTNNVSGAIVSRMNEAPIDEVKEVSGVGRERYVVSRMANIIVADFSWTFQRRMTCH
jgi:hypothetical protein